VGYYIHIDTTGTVSHCDTTNPGIHPNNIEAHVEDRPGDLLLGNLKRLSRRLQLVYDAPSRLTPG